MAAAAVSFCCPAAARADTDVDTGADAGSGPDDLAGLTIEELANIEVRSVSKSSEPLSAAPAALYVITNQDIRTSPATSLPEVLRMAPNLGVQQVDAGQYAISARGFNGIETSNKLLVLIDGRTIYTPLSSGVLWELHSPLLEDIDQIEVISGPGGTLYGPNAVNGVINVASKSAFNTIGVLARGAIGGQDRNAALRYGLALGGSGAVRVYGNWQDRKGLATGVGPDVDDRRRGWQAGFRADFATSDDEFTIQGDVFDQKTYALAGDGASGHNVLARWSRVLNAKTSLQVQAFYDRYERQNQMSGDALTTFDVDAQLNLAAGAHELVVGGGIRTLRDDFFNDQNVFQLDPPSRRLWIWNGFIQDRFHLSRALSLTAGLKVQRSSFSGLELLPNLRLAWQPDDRMLLWAAASRAVRSPSRIDRQLVAPGFLAPSDFRSEKLIALEAGYRGRPIDAVTLSISAFYNFYDDIRTTEFTDGTLPIRLGNGISGETWGIEAWATAGLTPGWRLNLGLSTLWKDFRVEPGRLDLAQLDSIGYDPTWQIVARSEFDIGSRAQLMLGLRAVDELDRGVPIDGYVEAEGRLSYRIDERFELFASGLNLLHDRHAESNDPDRAQLPERKVLVGALMRY